MIDSTFEESPLVTKLRCTLQLIISSIIDWNDWYKRLREETDRVNGIRIADRCAWYLRDAAARAGRVVELLCLPKTASDCQGTNRHCYAAIGNRAEAA